MGTTKTASTMTPSGFTLPASATLNIKAGRKPRSQALWNKQTAGLNIIRDQLSLEYWVLIGAALQALLVVLAPARWKTMIVMPVLALATWKALQAIVYVSSYGPGPGDGSNVIRAKLGATLEHDVKSDGGICLLILGTRSYHPLGLFAPGFKDLGGYLQSMLKVLESNAEEYDFLGYESLVDTTHSRSNALKSHYYFRTYEGLHKFAHSEVHREGWNWWNKTMKQYPHLGIFHETYHSPAGHWEAIYGNFELSGIGATVFPYITETGEKTYRTPMEPADAGRLRTSQGRMLRTDGGDNDHVELPKDGY